MSQLFCHTTECVEWRFLMENEKIGIKYSAFIYINTLLNYCTFPMHKYLLLPIMNLYSYQKDNNRIIAMFR